MTDADLDLDAIEMRGLAATREPWHVEYLGEHGYPQRIANDAAVLVATTYEGHQPAGNAEFIAHAREDVPALVAEVRRLRAAAEKVASDFDSTAAEARDAGSYGDAENAAVLAWKIRRDILGAVS